MKKVAVICMAALMGWACQNQPAAAESKEAETAARPDKLTRNGKAPGWSTHAAMYEVNIRQYTPEGTIKAFTQHLDRLQEMGIKVLWIMPVQPIGEKNRKGSLGSYYSIKDYTAINPEFGTVEDFKNMVAEAHKRDIRVILDWVANHTAYDHHWTKEHPEFYTRNDSGEIVSPVEDWSDVADLNYDAEGMREAMQEEMIWWLKECDIDGFRCDVAMMVPLEFWNDTRARLDSVKPVFMLAEAEGPEFHDQAFDMTYGWELHHIMNEVARGHKAVSAIDSYQVKLDTLYQPADMRLFFTTNHDENTWQGTVYERMGANHKNFFVLAATFQNGMPLVYSGQEAGLNQRLDFFEKDTISFANDSLYNFYNKVVNLKVNHPALANGVEQGSFEKIATLDLTNLYAYKRAKEGEEVLVFLNFGPGAQTIEEESLAGTYQDALTGKDVSISAKQPLRVEAHNFRLLTSKQ